MHVGNYDINLTNSLFVSDLDGTLFNSDGELSGQTVNIVNNAIDCGLNFTIATGKSYQTIQKEISKVNLNIPCITYDGACINDCNGNIILCNCVDKRVLSDIMSYVYEKSSSFLIYSLINGEERILWIKEKVNLYTYQYFSKRPKDKRFYEVTNKEEFFWGDTLFISFVDCIQNIKKIEKELLTIGITDIQINQDAYINSLYWLKVKHPNANKGDAITFIKNHVACDYIVSFGNETNDIEMFLASDISICVANANNVIKDIALLEIQSNNSDGVGKFLESLVISEKMNEQYILGGRANE